MRRITKEQRRVRRVRGKVWGDETRPRLTVFRASKHIYAQIIDDQNKKTIDAASDGGGGGKAEKTTGQKKTSSPKSQGTKTERASRVGQILAERSLKKGVKRVRFDRGKYRYHGRIKALADAARKAGLEF